MKKNGTITILRKELARFFGDRRMLISIIIPGILIYVLYSFMGSALHTQFSTEDVSVSAAVVNLPASLESTMASTVGVTEYESEAEAMQGISAETADICVVFPADFDEKVALYDVSSGAAAPMVEIYYSSASESSLLGFELVSSLLDEYETSLVNKWDINAGAAVYDLISETDQTGSIFSMMLPMLLLIFLYSGCMAVGAEAIAGEKERGTIATMLITPVGRNSIAMGKIAAVSILGLISAASSTLGIIFSLPKLMSMDSMNISGGFYSMREYLMLGGVILSTVLVLVALICVISALAKSAKEAQTMLVPLMIVVMFVGVSSMFGGAAQTELYYYLIPLYNSVQCMSAILSFSASSGHIVLCIVSNIAFAGIGAWVLTRMFHSERIMFSK
ncbi:MAG: ABC transporter permease [Oscillospiraceae bacterium]|jgi:sodium transport system permease protein|nr:ABC transporter permease [Oscillospiraceae bacterium]